MNNIPEFGARILKKPLPEEIWETITVRIVQDFESFQKVVAVRSAVFMSEQDCPYIEEFDGNDLNATHLLALIGDEPVATLRIRWFANFGKIERVSVLPKYRGEPVVKVLLAHTYELAGRKGYRRMLAQFQKRLAQMWLHVMHCHLRPNRKEFSFSGYEYVEAEIPLPRHPETINIDTDPYVIIRPEGDWDRPGVLDQESGKATLPAKAA